MVCGVDCGVGSLASGEVLVGEERAVIQNAFSILW